MLTAHVLWTLETTQYSALKEWLRIMGVHQPLLCYAATKMDTQEAPAANVGEIQQNTKSCGY